MSAPARHRAIQVGLGFWGMDWAEHVLPAVPEVDVVAWVDPQLAGEHGRPTFATLAEALERVDAPLVIATVGIEAHYSVTREALEAGRHVLLEKPFALSLDQAAELVALAEQQQRVLLIAQNFRFWSAPPAVLHELRTGTIGEVLHAQVAFRRDHAAYPPALTAPLGSATRSVLYQIAVHHFDLMRYLLGDIVAVEARRWKTVTEELLTLSAFSATVELESGVSVEYSANQLSLARSTPWTGAWQIEGTLGSLFWQGDAPGAPSTLVLQRAFDEPRALPVREPKVSDRRAVLLAFIDAIESGTECGISGRDNLNTMFAVDRVAQALGQTAPPR
jgi:predicted dehydrogenase